MWIHEFMPYELSIAVDLEYFLHLKGSTEYH